MINVLYAGNYKVYDGILLSIMSMVRHCKAPLNIFILTADLTDIDSGFKPIGHREASLLDEYVKNVNPESSVQLIYLMNDFAEWVKRSINKDNRYTPFMFLRLFADNMDELPSKIIYLDSDIMFNGDIAELFGYDIAKYEMGVVLDRYGSMWIRPGYFNSGVLLLNLEKIKETKLFAKVRDVCRLKRMKFPDQSALNKCAKHILYLDRKFNEQGNLKADTIIQHFSKRIVWFPYIHTRNIKQYHISDVHNKLKCFAYDDIYDEYYRIKLRKNEP